MSKINTIDTETGNYVKFDYKAKKIVKTIAKADDILCYGSWGYKGVDVILKEDVPDWETIAKPKLLYRGPDSDIDFTVINPETGPSIIMCNGQVVSRTKWRVLHVVEFEESCWLITEKWALALDEDGAINLCWEHKIPDLDDCVIMSGIEDDQCITILRKNPDWTCTHYRLDAVDDEGWTRIDECQAYRCPGDHSNDECDCENNPDRKENDFAVEFKIEEISEVINYGQTDFIDIVDYNWYLFVDTVTKEVHLYNGKKVPKTGNAVANASIIKFYTDDEVQVLTDGTQKYIVPLSEDTCLPKPRVTNTKSARAG